MRALLPMSVVILGLLSAACSSPRGTTYSKHDTERSWTVRDATVVQVVEATIEGHSGVIGTYGGGFIGNSLGRTVGAGSGSSIAGAVGAVAGAVVGRKAEKTATQQKAWELLVEVGGSGETLAIVQPADQTFDEGEKVRVYTRPDGSARVAKL
jgi:outer membrane lipoprotein SlyB